MSTVEIQMIIDTIVAQSAIWLPAITAAVGIIVSICAGLSKIKGALDDIKESNKEVRQTKDFQVMHSDLRQTHNDYMEIKKLLNTLIDKSTGIKDYMEHKENENE